MTTAKKKAAKKKKAVVAKDYSRTPLPTPPPKPVGYKFRVAKLAREIRKGETVSLWPDDSTHRTVFSTKNMHTAIGIATTNSADGFVFVEGLLDALCQK